MTDKNATSDDEKQAGETKGHGKGNGREQTFSVIDRRPLHKDDVQPTTERRFPTYVEELQARTEEAERRAREISAAYRRIDAERDAFRERLNRDLERRVDLARAGLLRKVLDVLDDLDRAIVAASGATDPTSLLAGVTLIRDHLLQILASEGVQAFETVGQRFDPAIAEAIAVEATPDAQRHNLVVAESAKGYMLGGTLLRPARVKVARHMTTGADAPKDDRQAQVPARETPSRAGASEPDVQSSSPPAIESPAATEPIAPLRADPRAPGRRSPGAARSPGDGR